MKVESGFKSSEFYLTLAPIIVSMLVLMGVVGETESSQIVELVKNSIAGIVAIAGIISYILSRTQLKQTAIERSTQVAG